MFEDDDFAIRIRDAGYRVVGARDCFVHHFGQGSFGKLSSSAYQEIFDRNRTRFEEKWRRQWVPHVHAPDVRPLATERRYHAADFARKARAQRVQGDRLFLR